MTDTNTWLLVASTDSNCYAAQTTVNDNELIYRALSKWLIRGNASNILSSFWDYMDQDDNELEDALLDQLLNQAETEPEDPQITNVRTKDYSIDMTVHAKSSNENYKTCSISFVLFVYFHGVKKKLRIDEQAIKITLINSSGPLEQITVSAPTKTPAHFLKSKRVSKRSSKVMKK